MVFRWLVILSVTGNADEGTTCDVYLFVSGEWIPALLHQSCTFTENTPCSTLMNLIFWKEVFHVVIKKGVRRHKWQYIERRREGGETDHRDSERCTFCNIWTEPVLGPLLVHDEMCNQQEGRGIISDTFWWEMKKKMQSDCIYLYLAL